MVCPSVISVEIGVCSMKKVFLALMVASAAHAADPNFSCEDGSFAYGTLKVQTLADGYHITIYKGFDLTKGKVSDITGNPDDKELLNSVSLVLPREACLVSQKNPRVMSCRSEADLEARLNGSRFDPDGPSTKATLEFLMLDIYQDIRTTALDQTTKAAVFEATLHPKVNVPGHIVDLGARFDYLKDIRSGCKDL